MNTQGIHLAWIVVKDIQKAIKFYTEVVGLALREFNTEFGWAELSGPDGAALGIAQHSSHSEIQPGQNAVMTITVKDLDVALKDWKKRGVKLVGEIMEIPGQVKLQTFVDQDGNTLQLCQKL